MAGTRWDEARKALIDISNEALQYDADGIALRFLNSPIAANGIQVWLEITRILDKFLLIVQGQNKVLSLFDQTSPSGLLYVDEFKEILKGWFSLL